MALALLACLAAGHGPAQAQRNLEPVPVELQVPGQPSQRLYGESHALVIGASNYRAGWSNLPGVQRDTQAVAALLRQQGFVVTVVNDPTRDQLDNALRSFAAGPGQKADNRLLVYFAGHGHTLTSSAGSRLGYIVPVDAPRPDRNPGGFRLQAYSMESIEVIARQMEARHVLFIFDSCFSGTIFRSRSGIPDSISDKTSRPVRQFITAGDADQPVPDESIFRRQLEAALADGLGDLNRDGYITGTELGVFLEDTVTNYSRRSQTPRWGKIRDPDLDKGDFVFALGRAVPPPPPPRRPAPPLAPVAGERFKDCAECPEMVVVGAGNFLMGSPAAEADRKDDEGPQRRVTLSAPFALGLTEVTVGEFKRFVQATGYTTDAERNAGGNNGCYVFGPVFNQWKWSWQSSRQWRDPGFAQTDQHPVVCVSHQDAKAYSDWLSRVTGNPYRLPSESEWEYAARAGSSTSRPWGDDPNQACTTSNVRDQTFGPGGSTWDRSRHECKDGYWFSAPVGSFAANAFGLRDMMGNAAEWVQDCYNAMAYDGMAPSDGRAYDEAGCSARVLRGASWRHAPQYVRVAIRARGTSANRGDAIGFRLARVLP